MITISSLVIDGYNLIGISHRDMTREREKLIGLLAEYKRLKGHEITVVFDGWNAVNRMEERSLTGGVTVIYSRAGEKADAVISRLVSDIRKEWIVITSDREIISHAWAMGSVPVPSETFQSILEKSGQASSGEYELLDEEDDDSARKKGNPRKLSKKEKALQRVLRKL